jgi:hypothetical protein
MPAAALERVGLLKSGERLAVMLDVQNPTDPNAVALRTVDGERLMIGYAPRYMAYEFARLTISDRKFSDRKFDFCERAREEPGVEGFSSPPPPKVTGK